jgi:lysophospholipase L1-like esterase
MLPRFILLLLCLCLPTWGASSTQFQDGEQWCAVGDSITHGGPYHRYVYLYYATRFPSRKIDLFNCGISGDTAGGALRRLEADVLRHKPSVATLMLGMNDVNRGLYDGGTDAPDLQQKREHALAAHATNMHKLAERLHAAGCRLVFLTPSIYDETADLPRPNAPGVNGALGKCAEGARQLAREFNAGLVDFHAAMGVLNLRMQQTDPQFTLIGADRIHPGETGHLVMAYLLLKAQEVPALVADIRVDAAGKDNLRFTQTEEALPFPVPNGVVPALKLVPFTEELNQERLCVTSLAEGTYNLTIDGEPVGRFTAAALGAGINLAEFPSTPQYKQALAVAALDERRHDLTKQLRVIDYVEWKMGREIGDPSEFDAVAAAQKQLDDPKITGWPRDRVKDYLGIKPRQQELRRQLEAVVQEIRRTADPRPHEFALHR